MGDRLLERRSAKGLVARLPPPFDGQVVERRLREVMRDDLRLGPCFNERLRRPAVQRLPAALEQALIGRVADQRVLEAIVRLGQGPLDKQKVGLGETLQRGLHNGLGDLGYSSKQPMSAGGAPL
jgi:hypothetical protein